MNRTLLKKWFQTLDTIGALPEGGVTRLAYSSEEDLMFRRTAEFAQRMGFSVSEDCVGNMFISFAGREKEPCRLIGSHLDSVPQGGRFDGVAGVLAGLLVMEKIQRLGEDLPVRVAAFRAEESSLYGLATAGSGAVTGSVNIAHLKNARALSGESLYDAMIRKGYSPGACRLENALDFTELHIEQGRVLFESKEPIGVVTAIAAPTRLKVMLKGRQDHSGATPMDLRKDALCAAAEIILATEKAGRDEMRFATVATVGVANVLPNALNVVPGSAELRIDIRGIRKESISRTVERVKNAIDTVSRERRISSSTETLSSMDPVALSSSMIESLSEAAETAGVSFRRMASGAGHDAMKVAHLVPTGMLFIPCDEGISHNIAENASLKDIALGAEVMLQSIRLRNARIQKSRQPSP
jgi:N-carbamoyl-L-amino-acid hydrolase